jgi:hypothetical protein
MDHNIRIVSATGSLLALALLMAGCQPAVQEDAAAEKAIKALGARAVGRDDKAKGHPIQSVLLDRSDVTDAGLKELAGLKSLTFHGVFAARRFVS